MALTIRPFTAQDIPAAAALLARRHDRHRAAIPLLSTHDTLALVEAAFEDASGAIALRDGRPVGYLLGATKPNPVWGANVWVEQAGQAAEEPEVIRDLYAFAAAHWAEQGKNAHYVLVPATEEALIRSWFRLGFGHQHTHGIRPAPTTRPAEPSGVTIRRAAKADISALARLDQALPQHQGLSPVFSAGTIPTLEESLEEWESDVDLPDQGNFVAERDGVVIGSAIGCALTKSSAHTGLARPENAGFLAFAAVLPEARGLGAGRALGEAVLTWSAEQGYDRVVTDWRETNLLSSRAWRALGFTDSFIRLHRLLGH